MLSYVVREADGSLRDAESVLDQVIAYSGSHVSEKDVVDVIGVVQREVAYDIVECVVGKDPKGGLDIIARTLEEGNDVYQIYKGLLSVPQGHAYDKGLEREAPLRLHGQRGVREGGGAALGRSSTGRYRACSSTSSSAEDLIRGIFPRVSLEVLFIGLYNLSRSWTA